MNIKRKISQDERGLIRFLLYKGDEIDYMEQYGISPIIFNDRLKTIIDVYSSENLQEMLLKENMEITLSEASLIMQCLP